KTEPFEGADYAGLKVSMVSEDGEEGYPGTVNVTVSYRFDDNNTLTVNYKATTDKKTVVNLSQHSYFNLNGHSSGSITDHEVTLYASHYTPVDETLIPVGGIVSADGTPMDFRNAKAIERDINIDHEQLVFGGGYDHNWVLDRESENELELAASVFSPKTGRVLEVMTDQPGIQFYTGNFLDGTVTGKEGTAYEARNGFCLETQHFPDSPNQPDFPSTILNSGDVYETTTVFKFLTR
ncbi:MAG: galactose mutarotase, partial [Emcibacteraceae bacterium]|nr:galactose mutarotase [Emcibacteraceae bacterium]